LVERWPLSAGSPPSGPIDFTAASGGAPAGLREHIESFREGEEAPYYRGDFSGEGGAQIRPLEAGWRLGGGWTVRRCSAGTAGATTSCKFLGGIDRRHIAGALRIPHDVPMRADRLYDARVLNRDRPQDQAEWVPDPYYEPRAR
jgi:hypothetical protein